jgi:hypothetical protein
MTIVKIRQLRYGRDSHQYAMALHDRYVRRLMRTFPGRVKLWWGSLRPIRYHARKALPWMLWVLGWVLVCFGSPNN